MHSAVTSAEMAASAVMKMSVLRRCRGQVTCEIHLGLEIAGIQRCWRVHSGLLITKYGTNSVELRGFEPQLLPGQMPSELSFRYGSFRFVPAGYLRFRFRILAPSRALAHSAARQSSLPRAGGD